LEACLETGGQDLETSYEVTAERNTGFLEDADFIYGYTPLTHAEENFS
jgi:hypothetical protein